MKAAYWGGRGNIVEWTFFCGLNMPVLRSTIYIFRMLLNSLHDLWYGVPKTIRKYLVFVIPLAHSLRRSLSI